MSTASTSRKVSPGTQGTIHLGEIRHAITNTRSTFTRVRTQHSDHVIAERPGTQADFITLVSLICNIYRDSENDLIPVQQFHPDAERHEDGGHTCVVSQRAISTNAASNYKRGTTDSVAEDIVVKRTRHSVLEPQSSGLRSLINELSIRTHPPIRGHPNIVKFKGIAWDFEDEGATKPRPLLLEELAPQRSLEGFWSKYNFVRMTFQAKIELCLDIAEGLTILHACHIVHGDVKPENILIFPRIGCQDSFMAKLTDFGHSASAHEERISLPAFTQQWCAPEVLLDDHRLDFEGMIATDVYSFGLVVLSIIIGRSYYKSLENYTTLKQAGLMLTSAMQLVEQEDRQSHDSDFELDTIRALMHATIRRKPTRRSLSRCIRILKKYLTTRDFSSSLTAAPISYGSLAKLAGLDVDRTISIGYQTLALCSHQLKELVVQDLKLIAENSEDTRNAVAAWELSVCYFSGFGVSKDFNNSSYWLNVALLRGIPAAKTFNHQLHQAMHMRSPSYTSGDILNDVYSQRSVQQPPNCEKNKTIGQQDAEIFTQNEDQNAQNTIEQLQQLELEEYVTDLESDSDARSEVSETRVHGRRVSLEKCMTDAIANGQSAELASLMSDRPDWSRRQGAQGDTLIHVAARDGNYECMEVLLSHESADAGIYNDYQESALHLMASFSEDQFRVLIPKLVAKGADPHHEALPLRYGNNSLNISANIRCCSILRAILSDNIPLLSCLLDASHSSFSTGCRICEGGSKLKRIVAIALSTFRAEALRTIVEHINAHTDNEDVSFGSIEVWCNHELVPLWKTPFRSIIIRTIDLPESFFRAISYGANHIIALQSTISFLLDHFTADPQQLYNMLQEAVNVNSLDSVEFILQEAQKRQMPASWWLAISKTAFPNNPLILAIKHGLRSIFQLLWTSNPRVFQELVQISDTIEPSKVARFFPDSSVPCTKSYYINVAQVCLSITVTAAHQDQYFLNFILEHASEKLFVHQAGSLDDEISQHPTCFLAQAILTSSFGAATTISQKFPEAWQHQVQLQASSRNASRGTTLSIMRLFPDVYLSYRPDEYDWLFKTLGRYFSEWVFGEYLTLPSPTLPEYILLVGSYKHCQFLMEHLHALRSTRKDVHTLKTKSGSSLSLNPEAGVYNSWQHCQLTPKEFWCLMLGNLVREREDREGLWDVIRAQVSSGHAKKMVYLRLAIRHGTNKALLQLLDIGWDVNGPFWAYFMTPYMLSTHMEHRSTYNFDYHAPPGWDTPRWGDLDTHKGVFEEYKRQQEKIHANYAQLAKSNSTLLRERGGRMPGFVPWFRNAQTYRWAKVLYVFIYAVFLPLTLAFATGPYWAWPRPTKYKLIWMYVWSFITVFSPPIVFFRKDFSSFFTSQHVLQQSLLFLQFMLQHFVPLFIITSVKFPRSSVDQGYFVPACVIGPEAVLVIAWIVLVSLGRLLCAGFDCLWTLISFCCGKGFKPGPFGLL